jgi:hypothetical protein
MLTIAQIILQICVQLRVHRFYKIDKNNEDTNKFTWRVATL